MKKIFLALLISIIALIGFGAKAQPACSVGDMDYATLTACTAALELGNKYYTDWR